MRGFDRDELDEYEDDEEEVENEYEEEEEVEYKEEEPRKPTKEELEYLELRQRLKESIRKQMKKESSSSLASSGERKKKLPYDNYGSFFGPSKPVIAQRVIQESQSLLRNQHLASRLSNPNHINKNKNTVPNGGSKSSVPRPPPRLNEMKSKAQKIKNTRDYSFLLSDDAELPAPTKEAPPRNVPVRNSDARPAQVPGKNKQPLNSGRKHVHGNHEDRKAVPMAGRLPPKSGPSDKLVSTSKPSMTYAYSSRQLGNNSGNGPGRPVGPKGFPLKTSDALGNKSSASGIKKPVNGVQKPLPSKVHSSTPKQIVEQRKEFREPNKPKMMPKQPVASSKPQLNKPLRPNPTHNVSQDHRPKKKPVRRYSDDEDDDDGGRAISMIRKMFGYNPNRFVDDDDDDDMEANFDEIMREERRSAKIAKEEDEEQLRLLEEEEDRERKRRLAKLKKRSG
ncbi:hypothetical protein L6164_020474 [Bauhinia variegata]|uniref:Uncharacterized protein n=1 Tax=Bauhinia variegata TaxID=167791 RepID=A0ACB9MVH9_BAUVA|nr:hypothetical protein L6164_020474 [Bauhinia variegata]